MLAPLANAATFLPLLAIDWWHEMGKPIVLTIVIGAFAIALMLLSLWFLDRVTSYSIHKELEEKANVAVAIVVAGITIGIAIVVASVARG